MDIALGVLVVVLLTAATGYFVAQEFAYVAVDRAALRRLADGGDAKAAQAYRVTERLSFALSGSQFGITVTALLVGYAAEPLIGRGLTEALGATGLSYPTRLTISMVAVLLFSTGLQMVLGELAPKNLAIARTVPLARALARSTLIYLAVAGPVIRLFDASAARLLRAVGIEPVDELHAGATAEDLERIIDESSEAGALDDDVSGLLDRGLTFARLTVGQVMTPRVDVVSVAADLPLGDLVELAESSRHTRFPVVDGTDDVRGTVGLPDVLGVPADQRASATVSDLVRDPVLLPETLGVPEALERLRAAHSQIALVIDEHGGLAGVITFEDLAEELVGEILDEEDEQQPVATANADGSWTLPARTRIDEAAAYTGLELPERADVDTLSGLVLAALERMARPGDEVVVELPADALADDEPTPRQVRIRVDAVARHVPDVVTLSEVAR